jgi:hypothetical protein
MITPTSPISATQTSVGTFFFVVERLAIRGHSY